MVVKSLSLPFIVKETESQKLYNSVLTTSCNCCVLKPILHVVAKIVILRDRSCVLR